VPFDDDAEADHTSFRPPPHPDDRLWRHPSEMSCHPIVPLGASGDGEITGPAATTDGGRFGRYRPWAAFVAAGTVGAVLAGGGVIVFGVGERVVERPVTEQVALGPTGSPLGRYDVALLDSLRQRVSPAVVSVAGAGSGIVVRDDGIVVTSDSLVSGGAVPAVTLPDGSFVDAALVGVDPVTGLAVLDLGGESHTPSVLATTGELTAGQSAYALHARPSGDTATAPGLVGPAERYLGPSGSPLDGVEVEGDADPLALGGPLVDERGAVVGIVTAVEDGATWYVAPVEVVHHVAADLLADGSVRHAWLGIEGTEATDDWVSAGEDGGDPPARSTTGEAPAAGTLADGAGIPDPGDATGDGGDTGDEPGTREAADGAADAGLEVEGTMVASVVEGSPADEGGLVPGDVIVAIDGQPVVHMPDLALGMRSRSPGDRVDLTVTRADGSRTTLVVTLDEAPVDRP
jgi:S1-C subfamily serine protease